MNIQAPTLIVFRRLSIVCGAAFCDPGSTTISGEGRRSGKRARLRRGGSGSAGLGGAAGAEGREGGAGDAVGVEARLDVHHLRLVLVLEDVGQSQGANLQ